MFKKSTAGFNTFYHQHKVGKSLMKKKRIKQKCIIVDKCIYKIVENYHNRNIDNFLRKIAQNIS